MTPPTDGNSSDSTTPPAMPNGMTPPTDGNFPEGTTPPTMPNGSSDSDENTADSNGNAENGEKPDMPQGGDMRGNGGMTNGSDDVLLKYIDDEISSYSNIFDNAKTDASDSDKTRLISALKKLSSGEELEDTVDIEKVIRYFVVHNFVLNFDSYTGSMIHNYYLYEKDGQMQMIPWDYNLAFGGFQSAGGATSLVNYPIDSTVSGGNAEDRPMIAWIFASDEYTELYHKYFSKFISEYFDSGYFEEMIDKVKEMISPYVEKDPTKFCTYDEFEKGIDTLKEFCLLRAESISGQLDGTIGSTSVTQKTDTLIDAGDIQISDMGSMGNVGDGQMGFGGDMKQPQEKTTDSESASDSENTTDESTEKTDSGNSNTASAPQMPNGQAPSSGMGEPPDRQGENTASGDTETDGTKTDTDKSESNSQKQKPDFNSRSDASSSDRSADNASVSKTSLVTLGVSTAVLVLGIGFVILFRRRKR